MKNRLKYILSILLGILIITSIIFVGVSYANASIIKTIVHAYTPITNIMAPQIKKFPITNVVFDSSTSYFCGQHGTAYGYDSRYMKTTIGLQVEIQVTGNAIANGAYTSNPAGDIDSNVYVYINSSGSLTINNSAKPSTWDYKEEGTTPSDYAYTNWVYLESTRYIYCENDNTYTENGIKKFSIGNHISDSGISFILAVYQQAEGARTTTYSKDYVQHAVWDWLGQYSNSEYKEAADTYSSYHANSETPCIDTTPDSGVGATTDTDSVNSNSIYTVGPFTMSSYIRAKDYAYGVDNPTIEYKTEDEYNALPENEKSEWSQGESGYYKVIASSSATSSSNNLQTALLTKGNEYLGDIIKVEAIVTNESGATKTITLTEYDSSTGTYNSYQGNSLAEPGETFDIYLKSSDLDGYDELKSLKYTYRRIHANANGYKYDGQKQLVYFEEDTSVQEQNGCSTYYAYCSTCGYTYTSNYGGAQEVSHLACTKEEHTHDSSCKDENGNIVCGKTAHTHSSSCYHSDTLTFKCSHGYESCKMFKWKYKSAGGDYAQDGYSLRGQLIYEDISYEIEVDVPLKTEVEIYKYISQVNHYYDSNGDGSNELIAFNSQSLGTSRKLKTDKSTDTVKVERGDCVTFTIELVNTSRFETRVKILDTLPADCEFMSTLSSSGLYQDGGYLKYKNSSGNDWITIPKKNTVTLTVVVRPTKDSGKDVNYVKYTTTNTTSPTMQYTSWGSNSVHGTHTNGSIVNIKTRLEDEDWYEIKEYNVSVEKYIYDVDHVNTYGVDTTTINNSTERARSSSITEAIKQDNPVYVEYGDTVTYKIVVYNTVSTSVSSVFGVSDRSASPYWEPEIVYVDIEDVLPQEYSNLNVTVDMPYSTDEYSSHQFSYSTSSNSGGNLEITDLMVPAGGTRTLTITLTVDEYRRGTIEENSAEIVGSIQNINRGPKKNSQVSDTYCAIKNNADTANLKTSDYYILNNYNLFMDKYVYSYDESMLQENNTNEYTSGGSVTNSDGTLVVSRENETSAKNNVTTTSSVTSRTTGNTTTETANDEVRDATAGTYNDEYKENHPLSVEKTETIVYAIKATNEAKTTTTSSLSSGKKPATQVRTTKITDYMQEGLTYKSVTAKIYASDGTELRTISVSTSSTGQTTIDGHTFNVYEFTIGDDLDTLLNPGEYIIYYVTTEITESNMYLYNLENRAELTTLTNINHTDSSNERIIKDGENYNENIAKQQTSSDFVRMKDLVIGGRVWLDFDRDGYMNDTIQDESDMAYYNVNEEAMKRDIVVKLYLSDGTLLRTTKTDEKGFYTFGRNDGFVYYSDEDNYYTAYSSSTTYQRVDKASNKDANGNYTSSSEYLEYYIEYEYDGVIYKSTENYSGMDNLNADSSSADYGKGNTNYTIDSNAAEFDDVRSSFNTKYEYISYNVAYDTNKSNGTSLTFDKTDHTSQLIEDPSRTITARSFIKKDANNDVNESIENTNLLWLFKHNKETQSETPSTEYLKYINLGLELREEVDIALTKDVYSVTTTIDGEEVEYTFNQNNGVNGEMGEYTPTSEVTTFLNDYIVSAPYGLDLYESDYKYRVEQYMADAVQEYKGKDGESELNIEVTYRINVTNNPVTDDDNVSGSTDTQLSVKISEILDLYDENFMEIQFNSDGSMSTTGNSVTVKTKDDDGYLVDKEITIGEAWYYVEDVTGASASERYSIVEGSTDDSGKPIYKQDDNGTYTKKMLTITNKSSYSAEGDEKDFTSDGYYKTVYISGMEDVVLAEGEDIDIYVKYVIDKEAMEVEVTNEDYESTATSSSSTSTTTTGNGEVTQYGGSSNTTTSVTLERTLKIAERTTTPYKTTYGRGIENIAQVNAYSVWYEDGSPASLVDRDSNAGNIGDKNSSLADALKDVADTSTRQSIIDSFTPDTDGISADNVDLYEDMTYKTGIEIAADGTENTEEELNDRYNGIKIIVRNEDEKTIRELSGKVWDDSRSTTTGENDELQHIGNGIYNIEDVISEDSGIAVNENVEYSYINDTVLSMINELQTTKTVIDEYQDIMVRNVKAELIEIVEIPQTDGESRYYEEVLSDVTWEQVQSIRTDDSGEYTLTGFVPGKYIVRFTYGDTVTTDDLTNHERYLMNEDGEYINADGEVVDEANRVEKSTASTVETDMQVFNGQDYKTTQYAYELDDYTTTESDNETVAKVEGSSTETIDDYATNSVDNVDNYDVVMAALERPDLSDARDDEIRRLEVNNYSEVMVNDIAEVLRGLASGTEALSARTYEENGKTYTVNYKDYLEYYGLSEDATEEDLIAAQEQVQNERLQELTDNTYMYAETVEFLVKPEKLTYSQTTSTETSYHYYATGVEGYEVYYDEVEYIEYTTTKERSYSIQNIDMGIEYRPETAINLTKEIENVQLVTSSGELLVDLKFETSEDENGAITHYIDLENSIGADLVQFISNKYNVLTQNLIEISEEADSQGFVYINVEDEILQGCSVVVQYRFTATNNSEVDRIATTLNNIRYYANAATQDLITTYGAGLEGSANADADGSWTYKANEFAKNIVLTDVYEEDENDDVYRNRAKTLIKSTETGTVSEDEIDPDGTNGYYGKYVGYAYYTGISDAQLAYNATLPKNTTGEQASENDVDIDTVAELKFDKIIDYVDTSLEFVQLSQTTAITTTATEDEDTDNSSVGSTNVIQDVVDSSYVGNQYWSNNSTGSVTAFSPLLYRVGALLETGGITEDQMVEEVLVDIDGKQYKSLVVTTSDRNSDSDTTVVNTNFSRFLSSSNVDDANADATIYLQLSKTLAADTDTEDMEYENIAEVIQFTILNGRRTNFDTTIGNADILAVYELIGGDTKSFENSIEYITAALETDTSSTETISLVPPTGLSRARSTVIDVVNTTVNITRVLVIAVAVILIVGFTSRLVIVKHKKKRYK